MKNDKRVLGRRGARELTSSETDHVSGGINTLSICSTPQKGSYGCDIDLKG